MLGITQKALAPANDRMHPSDGQTARLMILRTIEWPACATLEL